MQKIKEIILKWGKSTAGVISLWLFVISIILIIVSACMPNKLDMMQDVCIGLATNLLGIIVTVSFVQYFLDKKSAKIEKIEEYKKIIRYSKYASILINEYIIYHNSVVTPMDRRDKILVDKFIDEYRLEDMCDLYKSSILLCDRFYTPVIERYYDVEQELSDYFLRMIEEIDFKYAVSLENLLSNYLSESRKIDVRRGVVGAQQLVAGGKKNSDSIAEELKNPTRDYLKDYAEGKLKAHLMTPIVRLYHFMTFQRVGIKAFLNEINKIEKEIVLEESKKI